MHNHDLKAKPIQEQLQDPKVFAFHFRQIASNAQQCNALLSALKKLNESQINQHVKLMASICMAFDEGSVFRDIGFQQVKSFAEQENNSLRAFAYTALARAIIKKIEITPDNCINEEDINHFREYISKALTIDDSLSDAWHILAVARFFNYDINEITLPPEIPQGNCSKIQAIWCYLQALKHDATNSPAWNNFGVALLSFSPETPLPENIIALLPEGFPLNNSRAIQTIWCYLQTLKHDRAHSGSWNNFGAALLKLNPETPLPEVIITLLPEGFPLNNNRAIQTIWCYLQALKRDRAHSGAWNNFGGALSSLSPETPLPENIIALLPEGFPLNNNRAIQTIWCSLQTLKHDRAHSGSWNNFGVALSSLRPETPLPENIIALLPEGFPLNNSRAIQTIWCYLQTLKHDRTHSESWNNLGAALLRLSPETLLPENIIVLLPQGFPRKNSREIQVAWCFRHALKINLEKSILNKLAQLILSNNVPLTDDADKAYFPLLLQEIQRISPAAKNPIPQQIQAAPQPNINNEVVGVNATPSIGANRYAGSGSAGALAVEQGSPTSNLSQEQENKNGKRKPEPNNNDVLDSKTKKRR